MVKVIGYMEGTDPLWLTQLQLLGYNTLPLSNGYDGHGRNIQLINVHRNPSLVVCYLHKLVPTPDVDITVSELLHRTTVYEIPVLAICPKDMQETAKKLVPDLPANVVLVDPAEILAKVRDYMH